MISQQSPATAKATQQHLRSKSGCVTCKAKHSKCDETRPTCKRCAAKGLKCGGYSSGVKWTFKHQIFQPPAPSGVSPEGAVPPRTGTNVQEVPASTSGKTARRNPARTLERRGSRVSQSRPALTDPSNGQQRRHSASAVSIPGERISGPSSTADAQSPSPKTAQAIVPASPIEEQPPPQLVTSFLTDRSSAFIINWFQEVCPAWSGFDSDVNWNRKIAIDLWQSSATVNSALESMSASFLASRLPSLRQASLRLMSRATEFIQAELEAVKSQQVFCTIPTGVLFAMFCMGTTICWVDSRGLGLPFFRELRTLLQRLNAQPTAWSDSSSELLAYFNQSMVYCEMLLAVVSDDEQKASLLDDNQTPRPTDMDLVHPCGTMLHPWTGISMLSSRLFAESIRLCRNTRSRLRQPVDPQTCFSATIQDLVMAQALEERLLALEFSSEQRIGDTGDSTTPESHLTMIAEAYRVSSLLHLYQTFPELALQRLPATESPPSDATLWNDWIVPLALHLVKILEQIPPSSGSRVIQPLLYISASTGLRHSAIVPVDQSDPFASLQLDTMSLDGCGWGTFSQLQPPLHEADSLTSYITQITSSASALISDPPSDISLQISRARHFIIKRLGIFESSLPPAPILVAKELVSTIWSSYDNDIGGGLYMVHWIDVMELNDLRSMFG